MGPPKWRGDIPRHSRCFSKWRRARAPSPPMGLSKKLEKYAPVFAKSNRIVSLASSRYSSRAPFCLHLAHICPFKRASRKRRLTIRCKLTLHRLLAPCIVELLARHTHYSVRIGISPPVSHLYWPRERQIVRTGVADSCMGRIPRSLFGANWQIGARKRTRLYVLRKRHESHADRNRARLPSWADRGRPLRRTQAAHAIHSPFDAKCSITILCWSILPIRGLNGLKHCGRACSSCCV